MNDLKHLAQFVGLGVATLGLVACGGGGSSTDSGTGLMSLAVTDAPIDDATRVVIRFTYVELKPQDGDRVVICLGTDGAYLAETASCPSTEAQEINLLAFQGEDSAVLFENIEIPAGEYDWIRFYLEPESGASAPPLSNLATSSFIEFGDYTENLIIPGGLNAGLQLVSGFTVPVGGSASFTVDFDLRKAIRKHDRFEGYHQIRRALRIVDNNAVGVITGTVDPALFPTDYTCTASQVVCPGLSVFVFEEDDLTDPVAAEGSLTSANVRYLQVEETEDWEYRYTVGFLSEGAYDLALTFEAPEDELAVLGNAVDGASVVAGETTVVDFE